MYSLKKKKEVLDYIIENDISIYQAEKNLILIEKLLEFGCIDIKIVVSKI